MTKWTADRRTFWHSVARVTWRAICLVTWRTQPAPAERSGSPLVNWRSTYADPRAARKGQAPADLRALPATAERADAANVGRSGLAAAGLSEAATGDGTEGRERMKWTWSRTPDRCRDCGATWDWAHHQGHGYCWACYTWRRRHGWDRERTPPIKACRDCHRPWGARAGTTRLRHHGHGYCEACYARQKRQKKAA